MQCIVMDEHDSESAEVRALRHHRDEIAACIKKDNFPDFVREVFESGFISQTVKDSLDSLDPNVTHRLKLSLQVLIYACLQATGYKFSKH